MELEEALDEASGVYRALGVYRVLGVGDGVRD